MNREIIKFTALFLGMVLLQVLICNHIFLFNLAMPIVFIYFIVRLPISLNLYYLFTFSFLLGFSVDIFSDTIGVNSLACTLLSSFKRPMYYAYVDKDDKTKSLIPSINTLGISTFSKFLLSMVGVYCVMYFSIEYFNFADVKEVAFLSLASCGLTFVLLMAFDCLTLKRT